LLFFAIAIVYVVMGDNCRRGGRARQEALTMWFWHTLPTPTSVCYGGRMVLELISTSSFALSLHMLCLESARPCVE